MLQIIGWILCGMLFVKGLEMAGNPSFRNTEDSSKMTEAPHAGMIAAFVISIGGAILLYVQGNEFGESYSRSSYDYSSGAAADSSYDVEAAIADDAAAVGDARQAK